MATADVQIKTERAGRYLDQFCQHATAIGGGRHNARMHLGKELTRGEVQIHADWTDTHATVTFFPWGQCTITADSTALTFHVQATSEDTMQRIQDIITRDVQRFGRRDGLALIWRRPRTR